MKKILKYCWRNFGIRTMCLNSRALFRLFLWNINKQTILQNTNKIGSGLLIIPPDPVLLDASVGDQAMIGSVIDYWKKNILKIN